VAAASRSPARPRVLLVGKTTDPYSRKALELLERETDVTVRLGTRTDPFPADVGEWRGDYLLSYLSPWRIGSRLLDRVRKAALNFHPGPPSYPGIGCTNFALYNGERTYGVTCHHMAPSVDTGAIVAVRRFPILEHDTVLSLTERCHAAIFVMFAEILDIMTRGEALPDAGERWTRAAYKRADLDALCRITPDMPAAEVARRVRATTYPGMPGPYLEVDGARIPVEAPSR
jgi:methionyl-tRNA formyltransferase